MMAKLKFAPGRVSGILLNDNPFSPAIYHENIHVTSHFSD
jgi:hypothetical protein